MDGSPAGMLMAAAFSGISVIDEARHFRLICRRNHFQASVTNACCDRISIERRNLDPTMIEAWLLTCRCFLQTDARTRLRVY
jgi:hypothetical protein